MHIDVCKLFSDLIDTQSFSATAEMHGVTQSAVSQKIRTLEGHFSVPLLERGRHCVRLTPEGNFFRSQPKKCCQPMSGFTKAFMPSKVGSKAFLKIATVLSVGVHEIAALCESLPGKISERGTTDRIPKSEPGLL